MHRFGIAKLGPCRSPGHGFSSFGMPQSFEVLGWAGRFHKVLDFRVCVGPETGSSFGRQGAWEELLVDCVACQGGDAKADFQEHDDEDDA